jgi:hypothetical protein
VSRFFQHAEEIFQTAQAGRDDCELSILIKPDGGIHVLEAPDWALEPLRLHHAASAVYRVSRRRGKVRLEARSAGESCVMEALPTVPPSRHGPRAWPGVSLCLPAA